MNDGSIYKPLKASVKIVFSFLFTETRNGTSFDSNVGKLVSCGAYCSRDLFVCPHIGEGLRLS